MDLNSDFFTLLGLPRRFRLAASELDARYRDLQARVHPDRFVNAPEAERRVAMQWASQANAAYQTLKNPLARARYLVELAGVDLRAETNTAMPADFLMQQMEWREAVQEARCAGNHHELEHLHHRLRADIAARYEEIAAWLDDAQDLSAASEAVRRQMFLEKLQLEITDALLALEE
ncbi:Fe-S protein assembly co-chaperone HscB [Azonexus sp.]|uniref:Fe-S protein assembly co-chaperone HscB n=1 Tax=Azonexus sp. TaxID=1872668 RepID=UPI0039E4FE13